MVDWGDSGVYTCKTNSGSRAEMFQLREAFNFQSKHSRLFKSVYNFQPYESLWKKYVKKKIMSHYEQKVDKRIKNMSTMKTLSQTSTKLDGKIDPILRGGHTYRINNAIIINAKMLMNEYANNKMLHRIGKSVTTKCSVCKHEDDTNEHMVETCAALKSDMLRTQTKRVNQSIKTLQQSHPLLALSCSKATLILYPSSQRLKVKFLKSHLRETRELIHKIDNYRNQNYGKRANQLKSRDEAMPDDGRQHRTLRTTGDSGSCEGTSNGKSRGSTITDYFTTPNYQEQMALSKQSSISDQFFATAVNTSNMMYVMSVMTPTGRRVYGKYGQMRPQQQLTGLEDVSKVVSIVTNSVTIPDSIAFYSSHEYNIKNALKIAEMSCLKIIPDDLSERAIMKEKQGWKRGSVGMFGQEKDRNNVMLTAIALRGHPTCEVFVSEKSPNLLEVYIIDPQQDKRMTNTDSLRISPRVYIGQTRTFRFLQSWLENLCEDTIVGRMPHDEINKETETSILAGMELWRPGSTSFLQAKFASFLALQGPISVQRLRTRESWGHNEAGSQFTVANLLNPDAKEIDMSKSRGDARDRQEEDIRRALENSDYSDDEEVFEDTKDVKKEPIDSEYFETDVKKEPTESSSFGAPEVKREVTESQDGNIRVKREMEADIDVKREVTEGSNGNITVKREVTEESFETPAKRVRHHSAEYIKARRMGDFIGNKLKVMNDDDSIMKDMESKVKLEQSEGAQSDTSATDDATYASEPADMKMDYRGIKKRVRSDSEEEWLRNGIKRRIIELWDAQFEELMQSELENRKSVKRRIAKKLVLKRLQSKSKVNKRRSSSRKVESTTDDESDETIRASSAEKDVTTKIDNLLAEDYGQETLPVKWQDRAKSLNESERKELSGKLTSVIDEMSRGNNHLSLIMVTFFLIKAISELQDSQERTPWEKDAKQEVTPKHTLGNLQQNLQEMKFPWISGEDVKKKSNKFGSFINSNTCGSGVPEDFCTIILDDNYVQDYWLHTTT